MNIRPAVYADSLDLAHIQVDSYRSAYADILPKEYLEHFSYAEQTQDWRDLLASEKEIILLVAETDEGQLAGYALGHTGQTEIAGYDSELDGLHVLRDQQRQGTGKALIQAIAAELRENGAESLMLWVLVQNPARALYERLGGLPLGRRKITLGEGDILAEEIAYGWSDISVLTRIR